MTEIAFAKTWPGRARVHRSSVIACVSAGAAGVWQTLLTWQRRASERSCLARMDERALKDMGITRVDAWREAKKPFWSA